MSALLLIAAVILVVFTIFIIYHKCTIEICMSKTQLNGKTALVTGGTAGMGLEIAKDFAQRGARVIVACPFEEEGLQAVQTIVESSENKNVVFKHLDLASFASVRNFAADILKNENKLDILMNNAGVAGPRAAVTKDGLNFIMQVNYYGAFFLTILLLPLLKKTGRPGEPSRIVNTSSMIHVLGKVNFYNLDAHSCIPQVYANSKLYFLLFSREIMKRIKDSHVVINNVDPGAVGTGIFLTANQYGGHVVKYLFLILFKTPWQGAQTALHVALDNKAGEVSGEYFRNCKQTRTVRIAYNNELAKKLWDVSVKTVKLNQEDMKIAFNHRVDASFIDDINE